MHSTTYIYVVRKKKARIQSSKMIFEGKGLPGGASVHCGHDALVLMVYGEAETRTKGWFTNRSKLMSF